MKALTIYALTWFLALTGVGVMYLNGSFSEAEITIFGFIFATLLSAGLVMVLPFWVDERYSWKY